MKRTDVPTREECHWSLPPVPRPLFVCWHPESDDCWNMMGSGQTEDEAYADLLTNHADWLFEQELEATDHGPHENHPPTH